MKALPFDEDEVIEKLEKLENDPSMKTESVYSPSATEDAHSELSFTERHLVYLRSHRHVNPNHYLSNLAIMIKKR